jgi:hypothetical protein
MGVNFFSMLEASFYSTFRIVFIAFSGFLLVKFKVNNYEYNNILFSYRSSISK